ncbi:hypothetical protein [Pseudogemmobacter faecipullorum]|uniref:Uncharacterized protein n=1 Tax=Pseudogemmobacter faecipullorum TaxID=2755041 RepID=A0ABS8CQX6_9RHOB|nr:hypothetical protein [Pseudogemmobacter faecipullorum]MCB5411797.1 hypothetical protein [Pseudogemmobacter faecipullorum]
MTLLSSGDSRNPGKYDGQPHLLDGGILGRDCHISGAIAAAPAGGLISREAAIAEILGSSEIDSGDKYHAAHLLRALPAAPEAGEVEKGNLVAELKEMTRRRDEWRKKAAGYDELVAAVRRGVEKAGERNLSRVFMRGALIEATSRAERAEARLAELEAERDTAIENEKSRYVRVSQKYRMALEERDAALAQVAGAYEAAAREAAALGDGHDGAGMAEAIRTLTPADATAAFERAVEARVQAALAAQGEPVVGDTPIGGRVRFAAPAGATRDEMRAWLRDTPEGQSLWANGDCILVWANEGDLFSANYCAPTFAVDVQAELTELTMRQKLAALSLRFYQGMMWEPKPGDYYTTSRADLELYQVVSVEGGKVRTRYCNGKTQTISEWPEAEFTSGGFGPKRVHVPDFVLRADPAPASAGVTVKPLIDAVQSHLRWMDAFLCKEDEVRSSTPRKVFQNSQDAAEELRAALAALSQPAQAGEG